jgi:hypothetical protein
VSRFLLIGQLRQERALAEYLPGDGGIQERQKESQEADM